MQHLDEGTIHAWLDGALSGGGGGPDAERVEKHVAECAECAELVAGARGMIAASSRILSALDDVPGGVLPATEPARGGWASRAFRNTTLRVAASIVLLAGGAAVVERYTGTDATLSVATPAVDQQAVPVAVSTDTQTLETSQELAVKQAEPARTGATGGRGGASRQATPQPALPSRRDGASAADVAESAAQRRELAQAPPPSVPQVADRSFADAQASRMARRDESATDSTLLRLLDSSTVAVPDMIVRRFRYEVKPGVIVTLEESRSARPRSGAALKIGEVTGAAAKEEERKNAAQLAPAPSAAAAPPVVNSINWIDRDGVNRTLSGTLPVAELEKIRLRIVRARVR
ncbi:MAG: hypothetical protein ABR543_15770 [Gemmatimonadaceae bacterium]